MIGKLTGTLLEKNPPEVLLDCHGVGYEVNVPMSTFYNLPGVGEQVALLTHFVVREDAQQLFGFLTAAERNTFRQLIKISGIGPRMALSLLDRLTDEAEITVARLMALPLDSEGPEVARLCHQLAGTSGTFGTRRLRSVLVAVEAAVRVGDQDGAAGHMAELPAVWSATRRVLRAELARLQDAA